jgi:glycerol dehydrogenase
VGEAGLLKAHRKALSKAWLESGLDLRLLDVADGSDCCAAALEGLLGRAKAQGVGSLIGFGGGRVLDLAKLAARAGGWRLATAPTSAATCACATSVAVLNDGAGAFMEVVDLDRPPELCVVETPVLRGAPARLLASGLADTLAKWLEWKALGEGPAAFGSGAGWALAARARELCMAAGAEALREPSSAAFDAVVEACLLWSSAASCAGSAPAAAAHSLANALGRQPAGAALLHGEAVGLGLLWQESLLERAGRETMEGPPLAPLLASWGLPTELPAGLDLERLSRDALAAGETVHLLGLNLTVEQAQATFLTGPRFHGR